MQYKICSVKKPTKSVTFYFTFKIFEFKVCSGRDTQRIVRQGKVRQGFARHGIVRQSRSWRHQNKMFDKFGCVPFSFVESPTSYFSFDRTFGQRWSVGQKRQTALSTRSFKFGKNLIFSKIFKLHILVEITLIADTEGIWITD